MSGNNSESDWQVSEADDSSFLDNLLEYGLQKKTNIYISVIWPDVDTINI